MLYELTLYGQLFGQQTVNRFNYLSTGTPATVLGSFALIRAFGAIESAGTYPATKPFQRILDILSQQWTATTIVARAAHTYDPVDFYEVPFVVPPDGIYSGDCMSPAIAYGFRSTRVRLDIDRGTKRFAGVPESAVGSGGTVDTGSGGGIQLLATALSAVLTDVDEGNTLSFSPCIVSKEKVVEAGKPDKYRYYSTLAAQLDHLAVGIQWQPYDRVRTQTSRQYGRGI